MGISKPRKNGQYTGGRPFPLYCPACRACGGSKPTHFYNSRGLCNICHRKERTSGKKTRWPQTPSMLSEKEIRRLRRDPLKWLREIARDSYASTIPPHLVEAECWRIVHVTACRWFGEPVYLDPIRASNYEDVAWSQPDSYGDTDTPAPIDDLREKRKLEAKRKKPQPPERAHLIETILKPLMRELRTEVPDLPTPSILTFQSYWTITWTGLGLNLTISGQVGAAIPHTISFVDLHNIDEADEVSWGTGIFRMSWAVFQAAQRKPLA